MEPVVRTAGEVNIIDVGGRMTLGSRETDGTGERVRDLLHDGKKKIVLNLEKVTYIDSASLGEDPEHPRHDEAQPRLRDLRRRSAGRRKLLVPGGTDDRARARWARLCNVTSFPSAVAGPDA